MECIVHGVTKSQTWLSNFHFHIVTYEPFYPCVLTVHNSTQYSQQSILWKSKISHPTAAAAAKSFQLCSTLCHPIDGSPPDSPIPGILQARTLEWGAIAFSNSSYYLLWNSAMAPHFSNHQSQAFKVAYKALHILSSLTLPLHPPTDT